MIDAGGRRIAQVSFARLWTGLLFILLLSGCDQRPNSTDLARDLTSYIESRYAPGLFEFTRAERMDHRIVPDFRRDARHVTFTAAIKLKRDYDFGSWEQLNAASLVSALGARPETVKGLKTGGNKAGDIINVTGRMTYRHINDEWQLESSTAQTFEEIENRAPDRATLIAAWGRMSAMTWRAILDPTLPYAPDIADATKATSARTTRLNGGITIASGPRDGGYWNVAQAIVRPNNSTEAQTPGRNVASKDAFESLRLLRDGHVTAIILRADEAAFAAEGQGPFHDEGTFPRLRAVASLFPEHIHVVVPTKSSVASVADLFGKRVAIVGGSPTALTEAGDILRAHRVGLATLADTPPQMSATAALEALRAGERDAVIVTTTAPLAPLSKLIENQTLRILPLDADAVALLTTGITNYVAMTIPARAYPSQDRPIATVGVPALLVSSETVSTPEVIALLEKTFAAHDFMRWNSPLAAMIKPSAAQRGISLPLHAGATAFYALPVKSEPQK